MRRMTPTDRSSACGHETSRCYVDGGGDGFGSPPLSKRCRDKIPRVKVFYLNIIGSGSIRWLHNHLHWISIQRDEMVRESYLSLAVALSPTVPGAIDPTCAPTFPTNSTERRSCWQQQVPHRVDKEPLYKSWPPQPHLPPVSSLPPTMSSPPDHLTPFLSIVGKRRCGNPKHEMDGWIQLARARHAYNWKVIGQYEEQ
ncbi:unnamed protein product [Nezara viridula]|uniref:Uncharacterized protein n=1 Tax=Nezara viridula TaxID=85310 RepID=A0A9P0HB66_NEZVI|nr:unnamed protein product [Nezara viridula]